jgi:hypothetical protein
MKKLLVKIKVIDIPYSPLIPAVPEKWTKDDQEVFEQPLIESITNTQEKWVKGEEEVFEAPSDLTDWVHHPSVEIKEFIKDDSWVHHPYIHEIPEQLEASHDEIISQTQGSVEDLEVWLAGDQHKYPEGYWVEYIDITSQVEQERINAESLKYLADTDWLIIREVDANVPCPEEIKLTRQQMRERIIK